MNSFLGGFKMPIFTNIKFLTIIILVGVFAGLAVTAKKTHEKNIKLALQLEQAIAKGESNQKAHDEFIAESNRRLVVSRQVKKVLDAAVQKEREKVGTLEKKLAKHDLESLLFQKPKMLEKRINEASKNIVEGLSAATKEFNTRTQEEEPK